MRICVAGDTHGELARMYACVDALEAEAGVAVDAVLQVGDFGAWPDRARLDAATKRHGDRGEFERLLAEPAVPRPTYFIAGNHEDFEFLARAPALPAGLTFIPWGDVIEIRTGGQRVRVGGIGGCYGPRDYDRLVVEGPRRRHYTAHDLERLARRDRPIDVLLLHEPPAGTVTELHAPPGCSVRTWDLRGPGLGELIAQLRPRICFTGHIHARTERTIGGVRTVGLAKVPHRGSVVLIDIPVAGEAVQLAEWGGTVEAVADEIEVADPIELAALARVLEDWATAVTDGRAPDRDARKRLHAALARSPHRAVLMGALLGRDPVELVENEIPLDERAALLAQWSTGAGLPAPGSLRPTHPRPA